MNLQKHKKKIFILAIILIFIAFICLYIFNRSVNEIVNIILISFALSYILNPTKEFVMKKLNVNNKVAAIIVILLVLGLIVGGIAMILPSFIEEIASIGDVFNNIGDFYESTIIKLNLSNIPAIDSIYNSLMERGNVLWVKFSANILDNILILSSKIISLAVIPIIIY